MVFRSWGLHVSGHGSGWDARRLSWPVLGTVLADEGSVLGELT